jgi:NAD(P)H-flavin reductase
MVADPWRLEPTAVRRRRRETADTFTIELDAPRFSFQPGQFNMLYLFGVGEVPISISGDPAKPEVLVHTIRAVGTVTTAMARLKKGDTLGLRGPYGSAWPVPTAEGGDLLIVAGGLGIAPLRPVLYDALRRRDRFGHVTLLYGARSPEGLVYRAELERWSAQRELAVHVTVDHADPSWTGKVGVVPSLVDGIPLDPARTVAMICGPEVMMRFTVRALEARGLDAARIYLSMERNMKCALAFCGHCQYRDAFLCKDGAVLPFNRIADIFDRREI